MRWVERLHMQETGDSRKVRTSILYLFANTCECLHIRPTRTHLCAHRFSHAFTEADPQIHSIEGKGFGIGNIGREGMEAFIKSHKCNRICKKLGLPRPEVCQNACAKICHARGNVVTVTCTQNLNLFHECDIYCTTPNS